jgi:phage terminase large subunit GpA-like protein
MDDFNEKYKNFKLKFELVPDGCWYSNLRSILTPTQWNFLKQDAKSRAQNRCAICGAKVSRLEAHEVWSYNRENSTQKLEDVISICHSCHSVIHIGRTQLVGNEEMAEKHFCKVNNCTYPEYRKALGIANEEHAKNNQISEWKLDLTWLKRFEK